MMFRSDSNLYSTATDAVPRRPVDPRPRKWPTRAARTRARATSRPAMRRRSSSYRPIWYLWKHCSFLLSLPFYSLVCSRFQSRGHDFGITIFFMKRSKVTSKLEHQHGDDDRGSEPKTSPPPSGNFSITAVEVPVAVAYLLGAGVPSLSSHRRAADLRSCRRRRLYNWVENRRGES